MMTSATPTRRVAQGRGRERAHDRDHGRILGRARHAGLTVMMTVRHIGQREDHPRRLDGEE